MKIIERVKRPKKIKRGKRRIESERERTES
jgi:hypothetical protein